MEWPDTGPRLLSGWQLPAGLAGASLLPAFPWRLLPELWGWLAGTLDVVAVGVIVSQSLVGSETLGLTLAWVLVGVLTYQYTPWLYPDNFKEVVSPVGVRALTALGTLYFGLLVWGQVVPEVEVVPVSVPGANTGRVEFGILYVVTSYLVWIVVFWVYFTRWYSEPLDAEDSGLIAVGESFFWEHVKSYRYDDLPDRWQWYGSLVSSLETVLETVFLPTFVCVIVGLVAVVLNVFYPLPEAVLFTGLVASRLLPEDTFSTGETPHHEIDLRLLDSVSGVAQNPKGFFMLICALGGMTLSGVIFLLVSGVWIGVLTTITTTGDIGGVVILPLFAVGMMTAAFLLMGIYSLVHWVRQLERIGPYARLWQAATDEASETPPVSRPPGLLVPAHLPVVAWGAISVLPTVTSLQVAFGVAGSISTVAVITMSWALVWAWRHPPQPLTNESRDLLVTFLIQAGWFAVFFMIIDWETMQLQTELIPFIVLVLSILISCFYIPDVQKWASQQEGVRRLLDHVYSVLIVFIVILSVSLGLEDATLVGWLVLVLLGLYILSEIVNAYLERYLDEE